MMIFEYRSLPFRYVVRTLDLNMFFFLSFLFLALTFEINHLTNRYRSEEVFLYLLTNYFSDKSSIDKKFLNNDNNARSKCLFTRSFSFTTYTNAIGSTTCMSTMETYTNTCWTFRSYDVCLHIFLLIFWS